MKQSLDKVIRHMVAWAGGDPCRVQLPNVKHKLHIHSQRVGDLHLIAVSRPRNGGQSANEPFPAQQSPESGAIVLCGVIVTLHDTRAAWLVMPGAGMVPVTGATAQVDTELHALAQRQVVLRGSCSTQGIVVQAVQAIEETQ